jgi:hypothetical protein
MSDQPDDERPDLDLRDANGHVIWGPRLLMQPIARMQGERILQGAEIAAREKAPKAERKQLGRQATRASRLRKALAGGFAPVRRGAA